MRCRILVSLLGLFGLLGFGGVSAGPVQTIKLATLAPDGSAWHRALMELSDEWRRATDERVAVRIYPGGVAGDDPDLVRKMRIGQLQAAALTVGGLAEIDDAFLVFSVPFFFDSDAEFAHVLRKMTPTLRQRLDARGFTLVHWGHGGWIHLFSKRELRSVEDLRHAKIFAWAGDDRIVQLWTNNGFRAVALASTDILTGLQTGMIDTLPTTPLAALSLQWFRQTPYMTGEGIAPLLGATVVTKRSWSSLAAADRVSMIGAAKGIEARLASEIPDKDRSAIGEMRERGLTLIEIAEKDRATWQEVADSFRNAMRESVPREIYDEALRYRDAHRDGAAPARSP